MIRIENLDIVFDKEVLFVEELSIYDATITAITGESGAGKTSLLYALGLIAATNNFSYSFDGTRVDQNDDHMKAIFRSQKIGYVFQENNLIDTLTVAENIKLNTQLSGNEISNDEINELLYLKIR